MRRSGMRITTLVVASVIFLVVVAPAWAAVRGVKISGEIERRDILNSTQDRSIPLNPDRGALLRVDVSNESARTLSVRTVRVEGKVMGLVFYAYDTAVDMEIEAGGSDQREFQLDLVGLKGQAVGLIPSYVVLLDDDREEITRQSFVADVQGSMKSVYGAFGLVIAAFTLFSLLTTISRLVRHRLPPNRASRAMQFATPGIGLGMTLVFTLSALRIFHPEADVWIPLVFGCFAVAFIIGYLTPSPVEEAEEDAVAEAEEISGKQTVKTTVPLFRRTTTQLTTPPPEEK